MNIENWTVTFVNSTAINVIAYDSFLLTMRVTFRNSRSYDYTGVSLQTFSALVNSDSVGAHFNAQIRPNYDYYTVEQQEERRFLLLLLQQQRLMNSSN